MKKIITILVLLASMTFGQQSVFQWVTNSGGTITLTNCLATNSIVIPDTIEGLPVTVLGDNLFQNSSSFEITGGTNVQHIGYGAFQNCELLSSVIYFPNLLTLGESAYKNSNSSSTFTFNEGLISIGKECFYNCINTGFNDFPSTLMLIGDSAFYNCSSMFSITIPDGIINLEDNTFIGCTLVTVTLNNTITNIGSGCFNSTSVESIVFPATLRSIGAGAFLYNSYLVNMEFMGNAPVLGDDIVSPTEALSILIDVHSTGFTQPYKLNVAGVPIRNWYWILIQTR